MGTGASMRSRRMEKRVSRRDSTASDETNQTVCTKGTTQSNRSTQSKSSNRSNTSAGSGGSGRRLRLKAAIIAAKEEALEAKAMLSAEEKEVGIVPTTFGGRCSMVLEDADEEDEWEFDGPHRGQLPSHMPCHPCAVEDGPEIPLRLSLKF